MISERSVELGRFLRHYSVPLAHLIGEEVKTGEGKGFVPSSYSKQNLTGAWASWWVLSSMCLSCSTGQVCLSQSKNRPPPRIHGDRGNHETCMCTYTCAGACFLECSYNLFLSRLILFLFFPRIWLSPSFFPLFRAPRKARALCLLSLDGISKSHAVGRCFSTSLATFCVFVFSQLSAWAVVTNQVFLTEWRKRRCKRWAGFSRCWTQCSRGDLVSSHELMNWGFYEIQSSLLL